MYFVYYFYRYRCKSVSRFFNYDNVGTCFAVSYRSEAEHFAENFGTYTKPEYVPEKYSYSAYEIEMLTTKYGKKNVLFLLRGRIVSRQIRMT